jgi:hypothetical protein
MLAFLARRVLFGGLTVLLTAVFAFGIIRLLRPELYGGQNLVAGTWQLGDLAIMRFDPRIRASGKPVG